MKMICSSIQQAPIFDQPKQEEDFDLKKEEVESYDNLSRFEEKSSDNNQQQFQSEESKSQFFESILKLPTETTYGILIIQNSPKSGFVQLRFPTKIEAELDKETIISKKALSRAWCIKNFCKTLCDGFRKWLVLSTGKSPIPTSLKDEGSWKKLNLVLADKVFSKLFCEYLKDGSRNLINMSKARDFQRRKYYSHLIELFQTIPVSLSLLNLEESFVMRFEKHWPFLLFSFSY